MTFMYDSVFLSIRHLHCIFIQHFLQFHIAFENCRIFDALSGAIIPLPYLPDHDLIVVNDCFVFWILLEAFDEGDILLHPSLIILEELITFIDDIGRIFYRPFFFVGNPILGFFTSRTQKAHRHNTKT